MGIIDSITDWVFQKRRDWKSARRLKKRRAEIDLPAKMQSIILSDMEKLKRTFDLAVTHAQEWAVAMGFSDSEIGPALVAAVENLYKAGKITKEEYDSVIR